MKFLIRKIYKKVPWLESKREILKAIIFDGFLIFLFIFLMMKDNSLHLFNFSFISIWILFGYILGRYSEDDQFLKFTIISEFIKSILTLALTIFVVFNLNNYIFKINKNIDLILIFICFICSFASQYLFKIIYKNKNENLFKWLIFGEDEDIQKIKKQLSKSDEFIKLQKLDFDKHNNEFIKKNFRGVLIPENNNPKRDVIKKINQIKSNDINIKSERIWFETFLQRIPSEFIKELEGKNQDIIFRHDNFSFRIKRIGDITLSLILLIVSFPVLLISAILIIKNDKGPIFYSQIRTGYLGKTFRVWKLRSMKVNAEIGSNPIWATKNDPRVTSIGKFIRKCRIDELPQLLNVINGSMSLIGPRPERPEIEETLNHNLINYKLRHQVKPGLSGWAQVNYPYGASILDAKIKLSYDLYYIKNQSLLLDILILFKTIRLVFNLKGSEPS